MAMTGGKLRRIIREEVHHALREAPLDDLVGYQAGDDEAPSIGHDMVQSPTFVNRVKGFMSKTGDHWVIITVNNTRSLRREVRSDRFRSWLMDRNYADNAKVLVVGAESQPDDFKTSKWFVHDVIGHVAGESFLYDEGVGHRPLSWIRSQEAKDLIARLHAWLVQHEAPISNARDQFDMLYDLFASIVLGDLTREQALELAQGDREKELVERMFRAAQGWVDSIPSDGTQATIVRPW
jgi:hypothetical protein